MTTEAFDSKRWHGGRFSGQRVNGASLRHGSESLKIHGEYVPVRAEVVSIAGYLERTTLT